jgi:hypothetical protein
MRAAQVRISNHLATGRSELTTHKP